MFSIPVSRSRLMAVLRRVAMICGLLPVRTWERSSSNVTSRTQWSLFSIPQWLRTQAARVVGGAAWVRSHWGIENRLHWVRDVTFDDYAAFGIMPTGRRDHLACLVGRSRWSA